MVSIKDIPYEQQFYWKGNKYMQVIRPQKPRGPFVIYACDVTLGFEMCVKMPSGRKVKPVVRVG